MDDRDATILLAELNDLLQLEYDALPAYSVAVGAMRNKAWRDALASFRADHEQHVVTLQKAVLALGGTPVRVPHLPTGILKLAVQASGVPGGDIAILLAFKSNEWQSSHKYARHAARPHPGEIAGILDRHAADEARHYAWAAGTLEAEGIGNRTPVGFASGIFARFHGLSADALESAGRGAMEAVTRAARAA